ncbi:hypothetical protein ROZALSC1DRAFT_24642 [Rozella allomycis CSF55]|uniref:Uncharacterized protein n=1 Tax=Rozella allomycis (strain CSF55) TaxID=988480 RepID=A0A4P9YFE1_ROZAC|nr:hypothetical protein ROZALSC1DRAFT_24642 [Rozella allomycis CSF55]
MEILHDALIVGREVNSSGARCSLKFYFDIDCVYDSVNHAFRDLVTADNVWSIRYKNDGLTGEGVNNILTKTGRMPLLIPYRDVEDFHFLFDVGKIKCESKLQNLEI